ncbi:cytochrome c oxidase assembly protein [Croceicoccus sp. YJ47]|uniref:cytochrome c oxidase assembly protein n=1 Tax=Croceicoccus sp. YJ47 TaxID=2798724 RepID=UPI001924CBDC|nr:cytochrome c oxidase assembly protein [Croceicoccus sp. YJ47]QQN75344.1 cytochrome c oxidase assembly protein [Croceicoccus sp. YJ47]
MNASPPIWTPYCGAAPDPAGLLHAWNPDPVLLCVLFAALMLGWRYAPAERRCHLAAVCTMGVLFISPLCALASALFTMRAIHHVALALVLAPLLARSLGLGRYAGRVSLSVMTGVQALVFWFWHAPPVYAAALSNDAVFWIMQVTLTGTAAFWWAAMRQAPAPGAIAATLATMVQMGALGALLTFAGRAFYTPHYFTTQAWGWTPLEDQQIAGLIMWAPASAVYLLIALAMLYRALPPAYAR